MSEIRKLSVMEKLRRTRSLRSFVFYFYRNTRFGQKYFLYNPQRPRLINISMNERTCMYKCKFCPMHTDNTREIYRRKSEMSWETLQNIVHSLPNDGVYSFDISSIGETLELEALPEYLAYMKKERPFVNTTISTNGLLLTPDIMQRLVASNLDTMQVSLFAHDADDYEWICGGKHYERVCQNIVEAMEVRRKMGVNHPQVQVFIAGIEEFRSKFEPFLAKWNNIVDVAFVRPINCSSINQDITPIFQVKKKRYPCIGPWYRTSIRSNGDVIACQRIQFFDRDHAIGNINEQSLEEIWQGPAMQKLRQLQLDGRWQDDPLCADCDNWDAYTNIWDSSDGGSFSCRIRPLDLVREERNYRGA
jgi:MoaA/NifB/PqqE/SkfB family radical SAM enzyme